MNRDKKHNIAIWLIYGLTSFVLWIPLSFFVSYEALYGTIAGFFGLCVFFTVASICFDVRLKRPEEKTTYKPWEKRK